MAGCIREVYGLHLGGCPHLKEMMIPRIGGSFAHAFKLCFGIFFFLEAYDSTK
jgi:hypothetical protein